MAKHSIIASLLAVIVLIIAGAYLYTRPAAPAVSGTGTSTPITTTQNGVTTAGGSATVTESPQAPQAPNYKTPLVFGADVSADVRALFTNQFNQTVAAIEKDATSFGAWINLGILRKDTGDYQGAKADWSYMAALYSKSTLPTDNLGDLYMNFIKDYPKAESNFKLSLANDPHDINAYQQLVSLYTAYGYKGTSTALTLLTQGLKDNPNNQTLLQLQAQFSK
jgi:tetratricopeptide (TPR) repeat protein